ncbi:uncharacterized protein LOC141866531 [Acropora palmata]|uniref:uncharacterized protein LOC141866531 n=1 Tax=Acropora palmata TaxID=6131 RepID=UPI003D9FCC59
MSSDSSSLLLAEVNTWNVDALRLFCRKRNLKVSGNKAELDARVFAASEMGIPVQPSANELITRTETEKARLLIAPDKTQMPDPLSLKDNWLCESDGLTSWPPIFLSDITVFLMKEHPGKDVDLHQRVLNEYKEGKAFRLFDSGFLKEVEYNGVSVDSDYCFMKARCTHSMSIHDVPHTSWVCAAKKSGEIASAYCTCVAGMSSSCIHVTALLFRVEAANRNGLTNPACTSRECSWNVPQQSSKVKPTRICDINWTASKLNKEPTRPTVDIRRSLFEAHTERVQLSDEQKRKHAYDCLKDVLPESSFVIMAKAEFGSEELEEVILEMAEDPVLVDITQKQLSTADIEAIEKATIGQSGNENWKLYRKGKITASNFHRVYTRVDTLKTRGGDATKLVETLQGLNVPSENVTALKYGRNMEHIAKQKFVKMFEKKHKAAQCRECGLFIDEQHQFLGATPDLLLECACCGKGVLEIKCPYSIVNDIPSAENLPYLEMSGGSERLKENHAYFDQIQGQMAITKRNWCYFYVYTQKGQYIEKIDFNLAYWEKIKSNLVWFYEKYVVAA